MNLAINHRFPTHCDHCPCINWHERCDGSAYDSDCKYNSKYRIQFGDTDGSLFYESKPNSVYLQTLRPQLCIDENGE